MRLSSLLALSHKRSPPKETPDRLSDVTIGKAHQVEFCSCESLSYDFVLVLFRSWCASVLPFLVSDF